MRAVTARRPHACAWCEAPPRRRRRSHAPWAHPCPPAARRRPTRGRGGGARSAYATATGRRRAASPGPATQLLRRTRGRWRRRGSNRLAPAGPVLDVGAGDGLLSMRCGAAAVRPIGLERDARRDDLRRPTSPATDDWAAIVFWHSLEHLPEPAAALGRAARLLPRRRARGGGAQHGEPSGAPRSATAGCTWTRRATWCTSRRRRSSTGSGTRPAGRPGQPRRGGQVRLRLAARPGRAPARAAPTSTTRSARRRRAAAELAPGAPCRGSLAGAALLAPAAVAAAARRSACAGAAPSTWRPGAC